MQDYTIKILDPGLDAVQIMSSILTEDHIFRNLPGIYKSVFGLYMILRRVEQGETRVIAALDKNNKALGVCYGSFDKKRCWQNHSAFLRGVNAVEITREIEAIILMNVPELSAFVGNIPENNRAALLYAKRLGYRNNGVSKEHFFIDDDNNKINCIEMVKIINEV